MKILFLLFSLLLLLLQGAAGSRIRCLERGGFCSSVGCQPPLRTIGSCNDFSLCCK
ncbi:AMP1 protein, partial [Dicaeum eximium]|nr:AMP1 protein [Dicaeum eximium]